MKKSVFFLNLTVIATFFVLFFSTGVYAGCAKDTDCKGDRVCEKGICVDPGQTKSSPTAIKAKEQNSFEDWLKKLDGRRYTFIQPFNCGNRAAPRMCGTVKWIIDVRGYYLVTGLIDNTDRTDMSHDYQKMDRDEIQGRVTTIQNQDDTVLSDGGRIMYSSYTISEDGSTITKRTYWNNGAVPEDVYFWQR